MAFVVVECPDAVDEDSRRRALCRKPPCPDFTGAGVYGSSPELFATCGSMTFFGACGPCGTPGSTIGSSAGTCGLEGGGVLVLCTVGADDEENLEEMLESHEGRRGGEGDVPGAPFSPGRGGADLEGVGTGADSGGGEVALPFSARGDSCSTGTGGSDCRCWGSWGR